MIQLPRVLAAAGEVQHFCQCRRWPFCFIGGIVIQRWGEPRMTQDVKPLLELKGAPEALLKLEQKILMVERRLRTIP